MRKVSFPQFLFALLAATAFLSAGCTDAARPPVAVNTPVPANTIADDEHQDDAPRISLEEAKRDFDNKTAVFIDTHAKDQYDAAHIPGAINIPTNLVKFNIDKIPKGKKLIAYCS
jgi:hypothetical protein